jgi:uncharacterized membrane protein
MLYDPTKMETIDLPSFALRSGPRKTIYHNPKDVTAAIVTCEHACMHACVQGATWVWVWADAWSAGATHVGWVQHHADGCGRPLCLVLCLQAAGCAPG